ncbi:MAG: hypothetical protein NXI25_26520, partial [bacterium]|nr:hypothetical protein [bacterium]
RSCCGDVAGDAEGNQPGGRSGGDPEMPRVEITKTLQDRKLAGWVHQALASSSAGASEPECTGFMATARSQLHISTAKGYPLCQHKQAARRADRLAYPLTTSDKFEAIAWEQRFCRTCLSKCPASFLPQ